MLEIAALLAFLVLMVAVILYSIRLQRRSVVSQKAVVEDHFAEKAQRQRQYGLVEESLELQKRAEARAQETLELMKKAAEQDEEVRALLRRSVEINEEILKVLRASRS